MRLIFISYIKPRNVPPPHSPTGFYDKPPIPPRASNNQRQQSNEKVDVQLRQKVVEGKNFIFALALSIYFKDFFFI